MDTSSTPAPDADVERVPAPAPADASRTRRQVLTATAAASALAVLATPGLASARTVVVAGPGGPTGPTGPTGAMGPTGPRGATGATGASGTSGGAGPVGATGATGVAGLPGMVGMVGPSGPTAPDTGSIALSTLLFGSTGSVSPSGYYESSRVLGCPTGYLAIGGFASASDTSYVLTESEPYPATAVRPWGWRMLFVDSTGLDISVGTTYAICLQLPV